jgi:hypothetical protein
MVRHIFIYLPVRLNLIFGMFFFFFFFYKFLIYVYQNLAESQWLHLQV